MGKSRDDYKLKRSSPSSPRAGDETKTKRHRSKDDDKKHKSSKSKKSNMISKRHSDKEKKSSAKRKDKGRKHDSLSMDGFGTSSSRGQGTRRGGGRDVTPETIQALPFVPVPVLQTPIDTLAAASDHTSAASQSTTVNKLDIFIYKGCLMPLGPVSTVIRQIIEQKMEPGVCTSAQVSPDRLEELWPTFQGKTRWDPNVTNSYVVYNLFVQRVASRFVDMLNHWKDQWTVKNKRSGWDTNIWDPIKEYWQKLEVIAKSQQCSKNRKSEPGGPGTGMSRHKGGSCGAAEVFLDIERRTGQEALDLQIVNAFHYYGEGEYTYGHISNVLADVQEKVAELASQTSEGSNEPSQTPDLSQLYVDTVGKSHGHIRGLGQLGKGRRISGSGATSRSTSTYSQSDVDRLLKQERERAMERERLLREELNSSMQTQFNAWLQNMQGTGVLPAGPQGMGSSPQGRGNGLSPQGGRGSGSS